MAIERVADYARVMSLDSFAAAVADGWFTNCDGSGELVLGDRVVFDGEIMIDDEKREFSALGMSCKKLKEANPQYRVAWYNK